MTFSMMRARSSGLGWLAGLILLGVAASVLAGPNDPIRGEEFAKLVEAQKADLQTALSEILPEPDGYFVTGPLTLTAAGDEETNRVFNAIRVICPDLASLENAADKLRTMADFDINKIDVHLESPRMQDPAGFRGAVVSLNWLGSDQYMCLMTTQQVRFMVWVSWQQFPLSDGMRRYALAVSDYLRHIDTGNLTAPDPSARDYGLHESADLYAKPPDYVIQGYDNYMNFLHSHASLKTDFAVGILAFVPSDSLLAAIKASAPQVAYPNKEWPMLQAEYRKFFARGGDVRIMSSLTREGFDTLQAGEYFFAVGITGDIRFGRELLRAEVERLEAETGRKVPRANHAFLFPGEPILTAGAFFIDEDESGRYLSEVNAQSGHFFYSNVSSSIREDITERSDQYLLTLGHFFEALDRQGIPCRRVLISKF